MYGYRICLIIDNCVLSRHLLAVDFKAVMSGHDPLMVLKPHLSNENVHVVAKVAAKIPLSSGGHLQASDIFKTFAEKLFWEMPLNKEKNNTEVNLLKLIEVAS